MRFYAACAWTCKCSVWRSSQSPWNNVQWVEDNFVVAAAHSSLMKSPRKKLLSRQKTLYCQKFLKCQQGCSPWKKSLNTPGLFSLVFLCALPSFIRYMSNQVNKYSADLCTHGERVLLPDVSKVFVLRAVNFFQKLSFLCRTGTARTCSLQCAQQMFLFSAGSVLDSNGGTWRGEGRKEELPPCFYLSIRFCAWVKMSSLKYSAIWVVSSQAHTI